MNAEFQTWDGHVGIQAEEEQYHIRYVDGHNTVAVYVCGGYGDDFEYMTYETLGEFINDLVGVRNRMTLTRIHANQDV